MTTSDRPFASDSPFTSDTPLPSDTFGFEHAYAVVTPGGTLFQFGDASREFPLMSVTKPIVAWAVLVAIEKGQADLDDPAGPEGSTVEHLLAHASGLGPDDDTRLARVGAKRIYSNYGFAVLGRYLEERTGVPLGDYVAREVFDPLGMTHSRVPGHPAYSGISTIEDLDALARELLAPRLISAGLAEQARTVHFPGLAGILPGYGRQKNNDWGLGLEIRDHKDPHWTGPSFPPETFGHFGQSGSFLWVDPTIQRAGVFLGTESFGPEHVAVWPGLTDEMRALPEN